MRKLTILIGITAAALCALPADVAAKTAQPIENPSELCAAETTAVERELGIPHGLLGAISLAETGRWDSDREASFAWPWTVMAEGRGRYFETKAEAIAEVESLVARGISNIDVGCMQINMYYHGGAFADLEEALDPAANAAYAGEYLKNLYSAAGSWTTAAGYYHSMTPERGDAYREKVLALWDGAKRLPALSRALPAPQAEKPERTYHPTVSIDMARTAKLNARFRMARIAQRQATFTDRRQDDLAYWREARAANIDGSHVAAARRAQAAAVRNREFDGLGIDRAKRFEQRRMKQLQRWRQSSRSSDPSS